MRRRSFLKHFLAIFLLSIIFFAGCKNSPTEPESLEPMTDQGALEKIAEEDSALSSFDSNYNEEDAMSVMGKSNTQIYPIRVGHKVRLVSKNLNIEFVGDTAYGTLTKTYEGTLLISASYSSEKDTADTLIQKPFTSVITRKIIFIKTAHTDRPMKNWRIGAISLPEGGVLSSNIDIKKLTAFLPNGDTLVITSPNEYFLDRRFRHWWRDIPIVLRDRDVKIQVEVFSAYEKDDFVTLTYGADRKGFHRSKKRFELVSSTQNGNGYDKVYEQTYETHQFPGFYHAIINAFPNQVIFDDSAPVENEMWGIPYFVK